MMEISLHVQVFGPEEWTGDCPGNAKVATAHPEVHSVVLTTNGIVDLHGERDR